MSPKYSLTSKYLEGFQFSGHLMLKFGYLDNKQFLSNVKKKKKKKKKRGWDLESIKKTNIIKVQLR